MDMDKRKFLREFITWQLREDLLKDDLTIDYEVAETYLESDWYKERIDVKACDSRIPSKEIGIKMGTKQALKYGMIVRCNGSYGTVVNGKIAFAGGNYEHLDQYTDDLINKTHPSLTIDGVGEYDGNGFFMGDMDVKYLWERDDKS